MTEVRFYQLQRASLEEALPVILERVYARGDRALVLTGSQERAEALSAWLWTFRERSFLPHGTQRDGNDDRQPIYLTAQAGNPDAADVLVQCDGGSWPNVADFRLVVDMFDGNDPNAVAAARDRWRQYKEEGHPLVYYQQNPSGKWEETTRA